MKQNITPEQLNELSKKANNSDYDSSLEQLKIWADKKRYFKPIHLPLLSIGQMIEFLSDNKEYVKCDQWVGDEWHHWRVGLNWVGAEDDKFDYIVEKPELCDALFEAVKWVLEK